ADAVVGADTGGNLVLIVVPQGLVVVLGDVVDQLLGIERIAGLLIVIGHLLAGLFTAVGRDVAVVLQAAGDSDANPVHPVQQVLFFISTAAVEFVGNRVQAVGESLVLAQEVAAVEGAPAAYRIPQAVVEGTNAGSGHVALDGVHAA